MAKQFLLDILERMTLEEKLGQMTQLSPEFFGTEDSIDLTGPMKKLNIKEEWLPLVGSTLNAYGAVKVREMQERYLRASRLKIPLMFMGDVIHGYKTIFPIPLAMGCSFNVDTAGIAAEVAAKESSASGLHLTFAPMADLVRDPRWGRVMESPGEDPYLNACMTRAAVLGFQGTDMKMPGRIGACVKHFAGYGAAEGGRDYNTVDLSEGMLREFYLPAYKAATEAGVAMAMTAFNTVDRIPASANKKLMRGILREEWGFDGVVISDFNAVDESITHGLSADGAQAAQKCIEAGVDIEMMSAHYMNETKKLVEEGLLSQKRIDEAVLRILELKDKAGLFENPFKDADEEAERELHLCKEHRRLAYEVAVQCPVLLKNEGVLPLTGSYRKIGLAGPFACSENTLGGWTVGQKSGDTTLAQELQHRFPETELILAMEEPLGAMQDGVFDVEDRIKEACEKLKDCDVILVAAGENGCDTGEAASKTNLRLSSNQEKLIWELKKLQKPVALVIFSGRPLEIKPVADSADAILQAWFLGSESGIALADILTGAYNPSGRLSVSFPQNAGQVPVYYNCYSTGRPDLGQEDRYLSRYLDSEKEPLYSFGYGLSYSEFSYQNFSVSQDEVTNTITASVDVKNVSQVPGRETVQLYIHDVAAGVVRPIKELKGFYQIDLEPEQEETVVFEIQKEMLKYWNEDLEYVFESGEFDIMAGRNSSEVFTERIYIK